jgi:hypothetical protein
MSRAWMRRLAALLGLSCLSLVSIHAQAGGCEKDTDCKGDRVCQDGSIGKPKTLLPRSSEPARVNSLQLMRYWGPLPV